MSNLARSFVEKYYLVLNGDHTLIQNLYHASCTTRGFVNVSSQTSVLFFDNGAGKFDPDCKAEVHDMCVEPLKEGFLVAVKGGSGGDEFCQIFYLMKETSHLIIFAEVVCFLSQTAPGNFKQKIKVFSESVQQHPEGLQATAFVDKYYLVLNQNHTLIHELYHGSYTRGYVNVTNQTSILFFDDAFGKFDQESKVEVHDMHVEPLNGGLLVVVKGSSGGSDFCQIFYLTKEKLDLLIATDIVCFLSHNPGPNLSHTTEPLMSKAASAILKQKIKDFSASLQHPEAATSADVPPKIKEGNYLPRRNRVPKKRFDIEGYQAAKTCAPSKQETSKPAKLSQPIISKAKSCELSKQQSLKLSKLQPVCMPNLIVEAAKSCASSKQETSKPAELIQPIISKNTSSISAPKICIISHEDMLIHKSPTNEYEIPERLSGIMKRLEDDGLLVRCDQLLSERADLQLVQAVHKPEYLDSIPNAPLTEAETEDNKYFGDVYFVEGSKHAAFLAAGSVIQGCELVLEGRYSAAFAIVRPPGHHALPSFGDGFCILNNVAIAAKNLLRKGLKKILIFDIDVHHGNGSQGIFYDDDQVLVISIHSSKLPYPHDSEEPINRKTKCIGEGAGIGYNVNVNLAKGYGDSDFFYVMDTIVLPLASEFKPDFTLISAGYDALKGDKLGHAVLTPGCLATSVHMLKQVNTGRVVLSLEGGYNIAATALGVSYTVRALLEDPEVLVAEKDFYEKDLRPSTVRVVQELKMYQRIRWDVFKRLY